MRNFTGKSALVLRFTQNIFPERYESTIEDQHSKHIAAFHRDYHLRVTGKFYHFLSLLKTDIRYFQTQQDNKNTQFSREVVPLILMDLYLFMQSMIENRKTSVFSLFVLFRFINSDSKCAATSMKKS